MRKTVFDLLVIASLIVALFGVVAEIDKLRERVSSLELKCR